MCFILKLFNSCSSSSSSTSSIKGSASSSNKQNNKVKPKRKSLLLPEKNSILSLSASAIDQAKIDIKPQNSNSSNKLNEKTCLKVKQSDFKLPSSNSIEKAEKLKEKLFNSKFSYNKLNSSSLTGDNLVFKNLTLILNEDKPDYLKYKNQIIDYCNYCGYNCCECETTLTNHTNNLSDFSDNCSPSKGYINRILIESNLNESLIKNNCATPKKNKINKNNIERFFTSSAYFLKEMNNNDETLRNSNSNNNEININLYSSNSSLTSTLSSSNHTFKFSSNSIENQNLVVKSNNNLNDQQNNIPLIINGNKNYF